MSESNTGEGNIYEEAFMPDSINSILQQNDELWSTKSSGEFENKYKNWTFSIKSRLEKLRGDSSSPHISVVVPAYNEEYNILAFLESVAQQDYKKGIEVIIVANNCTDRTVSFAQDAGARVIDYQYPNIPYGPISYARQKGLESARGKIIVSSDADIIAPPTWVSSLTEPLDDSTAVTCVTGHTETYRASLGIHAFDSYLKFHRNKLKIKPKPMASIYTGQNMAYRTNDALEVGGYDVRRQIAEDTVLGLALEKRGRGIIVNSNQATVWISPRRVVHGGGALKRVIRRLQGKYDDYLDEKGKLINVREQNI